MSTGPQDASVPGWLLNELETAGRENLDRGHVARYDLKEDAGAQEEVRICEALGLGLTSTVVEFGCGTGQFTVAVAPKCGRVIAVDVSPRH
jgi:ubiquinone/menaquinone biosynthesis C-methylase UbiE